MCVWQVLPAHVALKPTGLQVYAVEEGAIPWSRGEDTAKAAHLPVQPLQKSSLARLVLRSVHAAR